ncbi:MAG: 30S ribosomal protein S16 [Deltaproteobacteria bacterium]|nr:30S ribosomal protein S16 [Deltaproteobacteria bacterium]
MAVALRLTRFGTKKRPHYRLVASDSRFPQGGRHLEILGTYDPMNLAIPKYSTEKQPKGIANFKTDRVQYWLGVGAKPSTTVQDLLKRLKISKPAAKKTKAA